MRDFFIARRVHGSSITRITRPRPDHRPIPRLLSPPPEIRHLPPPVRINRKARKFEFCGSDLQVRQYVCLLVGPSGPEAAGAKARDFTRLNVGAEAPTHKA